MLNFHCRESILIPARSVQTFQNYWYNALTYFRQPSSISNAASAVASSPGNFVSRMRNLDRQQLTTYGIVGAEVLGFFTVGEMIGRLKIVGYRSTQIHHED
jgi:F-type H+-transporting ATPase subunit g